MKKQLGTRGRSPQGDNRMRNRTQALPYGHGIRMGVRVFLLVILQVSIVSRIGFFGAVPDILLAYVVTLAVTGRSADRWKTVAVSGIAAGFLADTLGGVGIGFLALFYFLVGVGLARFVRRVPMGIPESLLTFLLALAPAAILRSGVTLLYTLLSHPSGFSLGVFLLSSALPEVGGTLLLALPVFFLFRGRD